MIYATRRRSGISSYPLPAWHRPRKMRGHGGGMDIWMESRFVSATSWHPDLFGALHLVDLQGSSPSSMLGATASLIRLKRNGVSGRGHLMPPLLVSQAGCGGRCPARRFAGGFPVEAPGARCHPLSPPRPGGLLRLPDRKDAHTGVEHQDAHTGVEHQSDISDAAGPGFRDQDAVCAHVRARYPAATVAGFPTTARGCVSDLRTTHACGTDPRTTHACGTNPRTTHARNEFCPPGPPGPDIVSTHGGNGLRFVESGVDRTPGEDRQYKSVYSQETAGCVDWQVDLPGVEPAGTADIEAVSELFGPSDEVLEHLAMEFELSRARLTAGFPWATDGGNQATGPPANSWIEVSVDGGLAAAGGLEHRGWDGIHIHTGL